MHKNISANIMRHPKDDNSAAKENNVVRKNDYSNNINSDATIQAALPARMTVLDIEKENRLSKVISLYSKGLSQKEIAHELRVDQWNGTYVGEIEKLSPENKTVTYFLRACDYAENCSNLTGPYTYNISPKAVAPINKISVDTKILRLDTSNFTAKLQLNIDEDLLDLNNTFLYPDGTFEGVSVGNSAAKSATSTLTGYFVLTPNNTQNSNLLQWSGTIPLLGDPSRYPYDSYLINLFIALPVKNASYFNITNHIPSVSNFINSSWEKFPLSKSNDIIYSNNPLIVNLRENCGQIPHIHFCPPEYVAQHPIKDNSTFLLISMKFQRNYSVYTIIAPIIGIFFLLGAVFALPSTIDQLGNRLVLVLGVFALIFTLPQIANEIKPPSSAPTVADTLISIIIVATIAYAISSIISPAIKRESWILMDLTTFFIMSGIVIYFLANYPLDIVMGLIPLMMTALGYGLFVRIIKSKIFRKSHGKLKWYTSGGIPVYD